MNQSVVCGCPSPPVCGNQVDRGGSGGGGVGEAGGGVQLEVICHQVTSVNNSLRRRLTCDTHSLLRVWPRRHGRGRGDSIDV